MGGVWTERDMTNLCRAFAEHGSDWRAVAAELGREGAPEECAVVLSAMTLSGTPLQPLATLHAQRLHRAALRVAPQGSDEQVGLSFYAKTRNSKPRP